MTAAVADAKRVGRELRIRYRNWRGEESVRRIVPDHIWYGADEWHPDHQWIMDAYDVDKGANRSFAVRDILEFGVTDG